MKTALKGLVLAGGKSSRMGESKARMNWHGKEQQYYLAGLLKVCCEEVFISCREEQVLAIDLNYKTLADKYENAGPFEAILTAFEHDPNCGWLIIACDIPLMNLETLKHLLDQRDTSKIATVFESPVDGLPEPLAAIWEPESYSLLKLYHQKEHLSLRKILLTHQAKTIKAPDAGALINVNTPEDVKRIREILAKRSSG
ncbi:MAG: molybdenum cofactor guanylyltransferase [Mucilaginibacter sp.]|uniref:molybdenum cofactor guanylyltransferase n=1 Tax=Mucilaginibacter sp. TaxID=1882438 RepID=UPI0034E4D2DE